MERLTVRALAARDVAAVAAITQASAEAAQWSAADYERLARGETAGTQAWIAECGGVIAGFVVTRHAADELEVLNIAVAEGERRKGIGARLMECALAAADAAGARRAFLEVRETNRGAIALYERCGFEAVGRRGNYYTGPVEAAIVLAKSLVPAEGAAL